MSLADLAEMEHEDPELVPEILPANARLSIKAPTQNLLGLFQRAAAVAPTKELIPGTSAALLEAVPDAKDALAHLRITASDGEQTVHVVADDVLVLMPGKALLPPHRLTEILKLAPAHHTKIEVIGNVAQVRSGRAQWVVQLAPGDTLSAELSVSGIQTHPVPSKALERALSIAVQAASRTDARRSLMQVLVRAGRITGCDGGRLHRADAPGLPASIDTTIQVRAVDEMLKALRANDEEEAMLGYDETRVVFEVGQDVIVSKRLVLDYPGEIERLLLGPAFSNMNTLTLRRSDLLDSVRRVRINSDPDSAAITLGLVAGRSKAAEGVEWSLAIRARDRAGNASQEVLEANWAGTQKPRELHFNHRYLADLLEAYEGDEIFFKVGDDTKSTKTPLYVEDTELGFAGLVQQMHAAW